MTNDKKYYKITVDKVKTHKGDVKIDLELYVEAPSEKKALEHCNLFYGKFPWLIKEIEIQSYIKGQIYKKLIELNVKVIGQ